VLVGLVFAVAPSGTGAVLPDASCAGPADGAVLANGDRHEAQTFAAAHTGTLTRATVEVENPLLGQPGDFLVQIRRLTPAACQ